MSRSIRTRSPVVRRSSTPGVDLRQFVECMTDGFFALDRESKFTYVNKTAAAIFGRSPEELIGRDIWTLFPEAAGGDLQRRYAKSLATGAPCSFETYYPPDAAWYAVDAYPFENGVYIQMRDVTAWHREQEAFGESREQVERQLNEIESIYRSAHVGLCVLDRDLRFVRINDRLAEMNGLPAAAHIGRTVWEVLPDLADLASEMAERIFETGEPVLDFELSGRTPAQPDVERCWVEQWLPLKDSAGKVVGINISVEDVTDRRRAEEALRQSEEAAQRRLGEIEALYRSAPIGLCVFDTQLRWLRLNDRIAEINGVPVEQHIGKTPRQVVPDVGEQAEAALKTILETGEPLMDFEMSGTTAAQPGVVRCWNQRWVPIKDSEGRILGISVAAQEITERKRTEQALRDSEERFRLAVTHFPGVFNIYNSEMRLQYVGEQTAQMAGLPAEELLGRRHEEVLPDGLFPQVATSVKRAFETKTSQKAEIDLTLANGTRVRQEVNYVPMLDEQGEIRQVLAIGRDITAQKEAEEVLRRSRDELEGMVRQRTAELHRLADRLRELTLELTRAEDRERRRLATVLHDHLQQLLVGAKLNLAGLLSRRLTAEDLRAGLTTLQEIIDQSLAASRSLTAELAPPVLYQAGLRQGFEWLKKWMADKHRLELRLDCEDKPDTLSNDMRVLAFQAVRELLFNVVKHANVRQAAVKMRGSADGKMVITVSDAGAGFDNSKTGQGGEGFGLFSIRERVRTVGGDLQIRSVRGEGTQVTLTLPGARYGIGRPRNTAKARGGDEGLEPIRVVLVDDHEIVREGLTKILAECEDIEVVGEAGDGLEAVRLAERVQPDVVVIDVALPRLDGLEATRRIKARNPSTRVIALSMHTRDEKEAAMLAAGAEAYLDKARASELLVAAIRSNSTVGVR